jgi:hypothetical protein
MEDEENLSKSAQKIVKTRQTMEASSMIVPMFKYSFVVYHREFDSFLKDISD